MSTIDVSTRTVSVRFSPWEKIAGLVTNIDIPRDVIVSADWVDNGLDAVRGLRAPGLGLPGTLLIGTWRRPGSRTLVAVRRGEPALVMRLRGQRYDQVIVSTQEAEAFASQLNRVEQPR